MIDVQLFAPVVQDLSLLFSLRWFFCPILCLLEGEKSTSRNASLHHHCMQDGSFRCLNDKRNRHPVAGESQVGQNHLLPRIIICFLFGFLLFFPCFLFLLKTYSSFDCSHCSDCWNCTNCAIVALTTWTPCSYDLKMWPHLLLVCSAVLVLAPLWSSSALLSQTCVSPDIEKESHFDSNSHMNKTVAGNTKRNTYNACCEANKLFFLLFALLKVSFNQSLELGQVFFHPFPLNVLKIWENINLIYYLKSKLKLLFCYFHLSWH